jgi:hypothetical protein
MSRGFVIMAQNSDTVDYVHCAKQLEASIKNAMPDSNVTIITSDMLPYGDTGGFTNDWQVYEASPYEYTIKLEADMFIPKDISYWWDVLEQRDVVVSTKIRNVRQELSDVKMYRKFIVDNKLPDVYNAITYFKKSPLAEEFFNVVKDIFQNWEEYKSILKCDSDEPASTDYVYSIACHIIGVEKTTMPFDKMSMIHMKQYINNTLVEDWTKQFTYEYTNNTIKINSIIQEYPFHYHIKDFSKVLEK